VQTLRLPTRALLHHRGCTVTVDCVWCMGQVETLDHLLCTCSVSSLMWIWINTGLGTKASFVSIQDLISYLMDVAAGENVSKVYAQSVLMYAAWGVWKAHNASVFHGRAVVLKEVLFMAFQQAEERIDGC